MFVAQEIANHLSGEPRDMQSGTSPEPHSPHLPSALSETPEWVNTFIVLLIQTSFFEHYFKFSNFLVESFIVEFTFYVFKATLLSQFSHIL